MPICLPETQAKGRCGGAEVHCVLQALLPLVLDASQSRRSPGVTLTL